MIHALVVLLTLGGSSPGGGASKGDLEYRRLVNAASRAWADGRLAEAIEALEAARALKPSGRVIFNLARAYEKNGDRELAIKTYESYLARTDTEPKVVRRVQASLEVLRQESPLKESSPPEAPKAPAAPTDAPLAEPVAATSVVPAPSVEPGPPVMTVKMNPSPARPLRIAGVALVIAGAVGLASGAAVGGWALSTAGEARANTDPLQKPALIRAAQDRAMAADVALVAGASSAFLGGALWLLDEMGGPR